MRDTKRALLIFGAGLLLGLVVVTFQLTPFERVASGAMALGLVAIPIGLALDWRRAALRKAAPAKRRRGPRRAPRGARGRTRGKKRPVPDR